MPRAGSVPGQAGEGFVIEIIKTRLAEVRDYIIANHYSGKTASCSYVFKMEVDGVLCGAITYGQPASPWVKISIRGRDHEIPVIELSRLVITNRDLVNNGASILIGRTLKMLPKNILVVSYADTAQSHFGYVYQASNWNYAGKTKERTDIYSPSGHSRHHCGDTTKRQIRSAKHRYWIATGRRAKKHSLWGCLPYPKERVL
jgi:hypothetical protein